MNRGAVFCGGFVCLSLILVVTLLPGFRAQKADLQKADLDNPGLAQSSGPGSAEAPPRHLFESLGNMPLYFEPNQGQIPTTFDFASRGQGYSIYLAATHAVIAVRRSPAPTDGRSLDGVDTAALAPAPGDEAGELASPPRAIVQMNLVGANPEAEAEGLDLLPGRSNYFIGNDREQWRTDVPHYSRTLRRAIYPGVDLVFYGSQGQLEFDFVVAPGADPTSVRLEFTGQESISLGEDGRLVLDVDGGELYLHAPRVFQEAEGGRQQVEGVYRLEGDGQVAFELGAWDTQKPLVIDPILAYSSYLGGNGTDFATDIAVDGGGNAYITGSTESPNFPVMGQIQGATGIPKVFITKLNADGTGLVYSTYLGGPSIFDSDIGFGIAVDRIGRAYVTGSTESASFPTLNAYDGTIGGDQDAFLVQLNQAGNALLFSTYFGGSQDDLGSDVVVDGIGSSYISGWTRSSDIPTVNPFQAANGGGLRDAFATKVNAIGSALVFSTYLGGDDDDFANGIAVDQDGNPYFVGYTESFNFPTVAAQQPAHGGGFSDAFIAKLNKIGNGAHYITYLGGGVSDAARAIDLDMLGNAYVMGLTSSTDFPTVNPVQGTSGPNSAAFVSKLNASGSTLVYSTYLGGGFGETGNGGINVDSRGQAYVVGGTYSSDFPTKNALQPVFGGGQTDVFAAMLSPVGDSLVYSTFLGGTEDEEGLDVFVDGEGSAYITGSSFSTDFPTAAAFQGSFGGIDDAFVAKISHSLDFFITSVDVPFEGVGKRRGSGE